jgi:WD40 repeat protein
MRSERANHSRRSTAILASVLLAALVLTVGIVTYRLTSRWYGSDDDTQSDNRSSEGLTSSTLQLPLGSGSCHDVKLTHDGQFLVVATDAGAVMWRVETRRVERSFKGTGEETPVWALAVSYDDEQIVAVANLPDYDARLLVWDSETAELRFSLKGHSDTVDNVAITADGSHAISESESMFDPTLRVWSLQSGASSVIQLPTDLGLRSMAVTGNGTKAYVQMSKEVVEPTIDPNTEGGSVQSHLIEVDLTTGKVLRDLGPTGAEISDLTLSSDGQTLVSAHWDGGLYLWDIASAKVVGRLRGHTDRVQALSLNESGLLASGSWDGTIRIWQLSSGKLHRVIKEQGEVESVALSPDSRLAATCLNDGSVRVWNLD